YSVDGPGQRSISYVMWTTAQTAIHIARLLTKAEFSLEPIDSEEGKGTCMLVCEGIGHINSHLQPPAESS
ncbi:hypothetical protein ElyMa_003518700, partial [Elysia marginata]